MAKIFHPLLALIASAADRQPARYVEFLKEENKILRTRIKGQVHTKPDERRRLLQLGKALGQAIEELITIVTPAGSLESRILVGTNAVNSPLGQDQSFASGVPWRTIMTGRPLGV